MEAFLPDQPKNFTTVTRRTKTSNVSKEGRSRFLKPLLRKARPWVLLVEQLGLGVPALDLGAVGLTQLGRGFCRGRLCSPPLLPSIHLPLLEHPSCEMTSTHLGATIRVRLQEERMF